MIQDESVTCWIDQAKAGDASAVRSLWERYFAQIVELARQQLRNSGADCRVADEEDVALSVLNKFFLSAQKGRYPDLSDRDGLWRLLIKMTANKSIDLRRQQSRVKRGGQTNGSKNLTPDSARPLRLQDESQWTNIISKQPTPELLTIMSDQLASLLARLDDPQLKRLLLEKMEGYTNEELAERHGGASRTIERRLRLIREYCRQEFLT